MIAPVRRLAATLLLGFAAASTFAQPVPLRMAGEAFARRAEIEVRDLASGASAEAIRLAFEALAEAERQSDARQGPLGELAGRAGEAVPLGRELFDLLSRAAAYCEWTAGRIGPNGGELFAIWGLAGPVRALPGPEAIGAARDSAACDRLKLDRRHATATLVRGSRLDLRHFALGWAIDRAVAALQASGAKSGFVGVGEVRRGFGPGPSGRGWTVEPGRFAGQSEALSPVVLVDRAIATASALPALAVAGEAVAPFIDLRAGRPGAAALAVLAASERALDAQALSVALLLAGPRHGQLLLGAANPAPAALWLVGSGAGEPLLESFHWSQLRPR